MANIAMVATIFQIVTLVSGRPDTMRDVEDSKVLVFIIDCCNMNSSGGAFVETWRSRVPINFIVVSIVFVPELIPLLISIFIAFYDERTILRV